MYSVETRPVAVLNNGSEAIGITEGNYYCFKGIPYAKAERFKAPVPYTWEGRRDCSVFGKKAMQVFDKPNPWSLPQDASEFSEDCLNLNIYVPADAADAGNLPVLVNIHGGSFQDGSNQGKLPQSVIKENAFILVTINYRLGIFGYAYLKNLLGDEYAASGNLGTLDQLTALRFIKSQISSFGGDPDRITVSGESAGAKAIGSLMLLPEFDSLASQVILSSGATQAVRSIETADKMTRSFLSSMKKVTGTDDPKDLLKLDAFKLIVVQKDFIDNPGSTCMFGPVADGVTIPVDIEGTVLKGTVFTGKVLLGSSLHELIFSKLMGGNADIVEKSEESAEWLFGTNSAIAKKDYEEFLKANPEADEEARGDFWIKILSDYMYRTYTERLAARLAAKGNDVWQYETALYPAFHVFDQMLAFSDISNSPLFPDEDYKKTAAAVGERIYRSFVNFVIDGNPALQEPEWNRLTPDNPQKMVWDVESKVMPVSALPTLRNFPEDVYRL